MVPETLLLGGGVEVEGMELVVEAGGGVGEKVGLGFGIAGVERGMADVKGMGR